MPSNHVQEISSDEEDTGSKQPSLVYKHKGGKVELYHENLSCLESGAYLKDNIIQFYTAYLLNEVCPTTTANKIHIFDSIFYDQLDNIFSEDAMDMEKFWQLRKWYDGIDIFEQNYLVFPICSKDHWIVVIVCHPGAVRTFDEFIDDPKMQKKRYKEDCFPAIVILDSVGSRDPKTTLKIRDFLDYEWRYRVKSIKRFSHTDIADYFPKLPKQKNTFDCGIFMLMYLRTFLEEPDHFYKLVRKEDSESEQSLRFKVRTNLNQNDREAMKNLITSVCTAV